MNFVNHNKVKDFNLMMNLFFFLSFYSFILYKIFFIYIKISNNLSAKYYPERLQKKAHDRYQNLSEEKK